MTPDHKLDLWLKSYSNLLDKLQPKVGLVAYDILFAYVVVEAKSKTLKRLIWKTLKLSHRKCSTGRPIE